MQRVKKKRELNYTTTIRSKSNWLFR